MVWIDSYRPRWWRAYRESIAVQYERNPHHRRQVSVRKRCAITREKATMATGEIFHEDNVVGSISESMALASQLRCAIAWRGLAAGEPQKHFITELVVGNKKTETSSIFFGERTRFFLCLGMRSPLRSINCCGHEIKCPYTMSSPFLV